MNNKKLYLDDLRNPVDSSLYMGNVEIYKEDWVVVRNYKQFVDYIENNGVPDIVSFDHDLAEEKTGADCAKWLGEYLIENGIPIPKYYIHSMNPVGAINIRSIMKTCEKVMKKGN
jgi:hypothetical protein